MGPSNWLPGGVMASNEMDPRMQLLAQQNQQPIELTQGQGLGVVDQTGPVGFDGAGQLNMGPLHMMRNLRGMHGESSPSLQDTATQVSGEMKAPSDVIDRSKIGAADMLGQPGSGGGIGLMNTLGIVNMGMGIGSQIFNALQPKPRQRRQVSPGRAQNLFAK